MATVMSLSSATLLHYETYVRSNDLVPVEDLGNLGPVERGHIADETSGSAHEAIGRRQRLRVGASEQTAY